jgi:hypothetical protein
MEVMCVSTDFNMNFMIILHLSLFSDIHVTLVQPSLNGAQSADTSTHTVLAT